MWLLLLVLVGLILLYRWYRQSLILQNLSDKYVFITGCDSGFGNLLAKQLDKRGMKVLATCLTEEGGLWGLVNNAGFVNSVAPNAWQTKADFAKVLNINLLGLFDVTVNLLPLIIKARGRIVNVSSCVARLSITGGGYCPSKFGVEALSDSLRRELRDFGVKVSIIEPGAFQTQMCVKEPHVKNIEHLWSTLPSQIKDYFGEQYYQQYTQGLTHLVGSASPKLYYVTDCMEHALTALYPWTRYSAGLDSKLYYIPMTYLPTVVSDNLVCRSSPKPAYSIK